MASPRRAAQQRELLESRNSQVNGSWDPTVRMAQMRDEYDRLVKELGMSPRGPSIKMPQPSEAVSFPRGAGRLPRVLSDRPWASSTG